MLLFHTRAQGLFIESGQTGNVPVALRAPVQNTPAHVHDRINHRVRQAMNFGLDVAGLFPDLNLRIETQIHSAAAKRPEARQPGIRKAAIALDFI